MKLWFSIYDEKNYEGNEKSFYNSSDYDWAQTILSNKDIIIKEFYESMQNTQLFNPYFNQELTTQDGNWKTIGLKFWSINNFKNQKHFPETTKIINTIPDLISFSFNKLEAETEIQAHCGDTNGIFRCHLGIEIPATLPQCGFEVNKEKQSWSNHDLLIFCDAVNHRAWNETKQNRYILLFDIIREEYLPQKKKIISTVLASMFMQKIGVLFRIGVDESFPRTRFKPVVFILKPFARVAVWGTNFFKVY